MLVRRVVKDRSWWTLSKEEDFDEVSFIWTQWKKNYHLADLPKKEECEQQAPLKLYGKMEHNYHLATKKLMFHNLNAYYKARGKEIWDVVPETYHIEHGATDKNFAEFEKRFQEIEKKNQEK